MNKNKKYLGILFAVLLALLVGFILGRNTNNTNNQVVVTPTPEVTTDTSTPTPTPSTDTSSQEVLDEHGTYDTKDEVALFIHTYNRLPDNYMTKAEARKHGWNGGALNRVVEGMCIGGDVFSNFEEVLPDIDGTYYECDIDTLTKKKRGAKRIVFSDEGDIYYTPDHYETFELLYGADE